MTSMEKANRLQETSKPLQVSRDEFHAIHLGVLAQARREAWDEGYRAAVSDERDSMPNHTHNPYAEGN